MTHTVETRWRETRVQALTQLAITLEHALEHVDDVEAALYTEPDTLADTDRTDQIVVTGRAYRALLKSRVRELHTEANQLGAT